MTQISQTLERRLDSFGFQAVSAADAPVPPMFLAAVRERDSARQTFRVTIAASAAACFLLAGVTAYVLIPTAGTSTTPIAATPVAIPGAPAHAADAPSRPSLGSLTAQLTADPSAPLPSSSSSGVAPDQCARVGDRTDSPVTRDLRDSPPPP